MSGPWAARAAIPPLAIVAVIAGTTALAGVPRKTAQDVARTARSGRRAHRRSAADVPASVLAAATARYRAGEHDAAAALLEPLAAAEAPDPAALRLFGLCRLRLGAAEEALALLGRAHALAPDDPQMRLHHAMGLQATGRHREAVPLLRACQAALPQDAAPSLNLATALLALGDAAGALLAARRARLRAPRLPAADYTLGLAYLALGGWDAAAEAFRRATRLAPDFAEAWLNLGVALYRAGAVEPAKQAWREALAVAPDHPAAAANLAALLRLTGEGEAAEALLLHAIERNPAAAAPRLNLAADRLQEDRAAEALALLDAGPKPDPAVAPTWALQRSLALLRLGRAAEARDGLASLGAVPPALESLWRWRLVLLAREAGDLPRAREEAAAMEASLARDGAAALPEHRIMAHYDLARFWSSLATPARAMAHWTAGHRLLARFQPFSRAAYAAFVDATIDAFDADRLATGPRAANRDPAPVFIVGLPRSGTTLAEQIVASHGAVHGAGERVALTAAVKRLGNAVESVVAARRIAALDAATLDAAATAYLRELHSLAPEASRIVDKMPGNLRHLGLVGLMLPGARIILCERDPRDVGFSIFTHRFYGQHGYAHDLADLGWYIGQQRRLAAHWRAVLPNPILTVRLEDWVHDFGATLCRVLEFLDLPYDAACESFHTSDRRVRKVSRAQVRQPINARGLGRWRPYAVELAPLITELRAAGALAEEDADSDSSPRYSAA